ncbi:hypothetical protein [Streptomyces sp. NK15101]|uniref:hypothetical protein n=1 Tax=Streptomyces sp. NK15101 TaxID=2873261 RepID=UPI001CEDC785|nr:hypothetical protein [Streptomyces sp. NK15101]
MSKTRSGQHVPAELRPHRFCSPDFEQRSASGGEPVRSEPCAIHALMAAPRPDDED